MYHTILFVMPLPELFITIREVMEKLMVSMKVMIEQKVWEVILRVVQRMQLQQQMIFTMVL